MNLLALSLVELIETGDDAIPPKRASTLATARVVLEEADAFIQRNRPRA